MQRQFSDEEIAALVAQLDGTGPADPTAAVRFCNALESWLDARPTEGTTNTFEDERWRADLWFMQGVLCQIDGDIDEAIDLLQRSITCSKEAGYVRREILGLRALAVCFEHAGRSADSTHAIFEALDQANELGDDLVLAHVTHALTVLHQSQGAHTQMLESALRTCDIAERANDVGLLSRAYCSVGVAYARLNRADEGFVWIDRADALPADPGQPIIATYLVMNRMLLLRFAGRIDEAAILAEQHEDVGALMSAVEGARLAIFIAGIYLEVGKLDEAEAMLGRAAPVSPADETAAHLIEYYATAAQLFEAKGDAHTALDMLNRCVKLSNKTRGSEAQARLVGLERRFAGELAAKTEEIHHLRTVELVAKNQQLSDLVHQKEEILHVVAHDLRNPLAATQLLGESLVFDLSGSIDAESLERLESIKDAAVEMRETIDTLVSSDSTKASQDLATVSAAVRMAVAQVGEQSAERGVSIQTAIQDVSVMVDGALLRRSLDDVLWNAIETTRPGSFIDVRVDAADPGVTIAISGDITFDEHFSGGRSLYIARRLIERMNGSITLSLAIEEARHVATIDLRG